MFEIALARLHSDYAQNPPLPVTLIVEPEDAPSEVGVPPQSAPSISAAHSATRPKSRRQVSLSRIAPPQSAPIESPPPTIATDTTLSANRDGTGDVATPEPDAGGLGAACRVFAEGEVDSDARPALRLQPRYPEHARLMGLESDVKLLVTVEADGRVSHIDLLSSGGEDFDHEAQDALLHARFVAARKGGEAVAALLHFTVRFRLDD